MNKSVEEIILTRSEFIIKELKKALAKGERDLALSWLSDLQELSRLSLDLCLNDHVSQDFSKLMTEETNKSQKLYFGKKI